MTDASVHCEACGATVPQADAHWFEISNVVRHVCPACAADTAATKRAQLHGADVRRALIFGSVTAALAAALWYFIVVATGLEVGLIAAGVGWITAAGVQYGAGTWRGRKLQWLAVLLTLLSLVMAQFLITRLILERYVEREFGETVALPPDVVVSGMVGSVESDPAFLAFWAIALISAYQLPSRVALIAPHRPAAAA